MTLESIKITFSNVKQRIEMVIENIASGRTQIIAGL